MSRESSLMENKRDLVERELSYKVVGVLFDVYNALGGGYQEKYYQRALAKEFEVRKMKFEEQVHVPLIYKNVSLGKYYLDFLIEDKVILEIKAANMFFARDIKQILAYLKAKNIPLGILANFGRNGLKLKRVLKGSDLIRDN